MKKKKPSLVTPILWFCTMVIWIITVCTSIGNGNTQGFLFVLQCACVLSSGAAAVTNFIRYKRSINDKDE